VDEEKERQGVKCAIHNEEIRLTDRKEQERERRKRAKASRRPNNGKPARSRGSQQWQSTAHLSNWCQLSTDRSARRQTSERRTGGTRFRRRDARSEAEREPEIARPL